MLTFRWLPAVAAAQLSLLELEPDEEPCNPRYLAYCRAHGLTPAQMLERDNGLASFIAWAKGRA